jgi:hypothetical protein
MNHPTWRLPLSILVVLACCATPGLALTVTSLSPGTLGIALQGALDSAHAARSAGERAARVIFWQVS